jgi:hypothetical protein
MFTIIVLCRMCNVLFSYACILKGQVFICRYIFMVMYSFVPPFREATFCGVPSCVSDKLGCAAGEKNVAEYCSKEMLLILLTFHSTLPKR